MFIYPNIWVAKFTHFVIILSTVYDTVNTVFGHFIYPFFWVGIILSMPPPRGGPPAIFSAFSTMQVPHHLWSRGFQVVDFNDFFSTFYKLLAGFVKWTFLDF